VFTLIATATLAFGIGGTSTIFSMFDIVVWRPVPLPHVESLLMVLQKVPGDPHMWNHASMADVEDIRQSVPSLAPLASWSDGSASLMDSTGTPVRVEAVRATANFFDVLGVHATLGRTFQAGEDQPGHDAEVVLSHTCWRTRFGADPDIVGRQIRINGVPHTVIGVMPPEFGFPRVSRELWVPLALTLEEGHSRNALLVASIGRLKPGRTMANVGAELDGIAARLEKSYPETNFGRRFMVWTFQQFNTGAVLITYSMLLLGSAVIALLIACVNIANLQLARAAARFREVAVRMALGAGRRRIVRQLVTENLVLALAGAAGGLVAAAWGLKLVKYGVPAEMRHYMPGWSEIGLNVRTLLFASAVALLSAMTAGLAPALRGSRPDLTEALKEGGRGASAGRGGHRLRGLLVAGEIALATVLVAGAGIMVRSFQAGLEGGAQMQPKTLLTMRVALDGNRYREPRQLTAFYRDALGRLGALPGVRSAAAVTNVPYSRGWRSTDYAVEGYEPRRGDHLTANLQAVTPSYFTTVNLQLLAGRTFDDRDNADAAGVVLMSRQMSVRWRIGQRIRLGDEPRWFTIVGVVDNVLNSVLDTAPQPTLYVPLAAGAGSRDGPGAADGGGSSRCGGGGARGVARARSGSAGLEFESAAGANPAGFVRVRVHRSADGNFRTAGVGVGGTWGVRHDGMPGDGADARFGNPAGDRRDARGGAANAVRARDASGGDGIRGGAAAGAGAGAGVAIAVVFCVGGTADDAAVSADGVAGSGDAGDLCSGPEGVADRSGGGAEGGVGHYGRSLQGGPGIAPLFSHLSSTRTGPLSLTWQASRVNPQCLLPNQRRGRRTMAPVRINERRRDGSLRACARTPLRLDCLATSSCCSDARPRGRRPPEPLP
jgi:putative ABC transport system permease protein